jgi:metallo-beta-lactamase class B
MAMRARGVVSLENTNMRIETARITAVLVALALGGARSVAAQDPAAQQAAFAKMTPDQQRAVLAKNPEMFLKVARAAQKWDEAAEPVKVVGNIYFVGTKGLGCWLITSPQGHVLLNTAMQASGPMIEASVRKLGFNPMDIKWLLTGHAHVDHVGGHAYIKKLTNAQTAIGIKEVSLMETGGKGDFNYDGVPGFDFPPVKIDRQLKDGDVIRLGDTALTAHLTPGHNIASITWTMNVSDGGRSYSVVFPDGSGVNPGFRLSVNPSYPGIEADYRRTLQYLAALTPDIWLHSHADTMGFDAKRARAASEGARAWVDPRGYKNWVASEQAKFDAIVAGEKAAASKSK